MKHFQGNILKLHVFILNYKRHDGPLLGDQDLPQHPGLRLRASQSPVFVMVRRTSHGY